MGQAQLSVTNNDGDAVQGLAGEQYRLRGVPNDWFVDPADPCAERVGGRLRLDALEDAATAFLDGHAEAGHEADGAPDSEPGAGVSAPGGPDADGRVDAAWGSLRIGLDDFSDEGELGWQTDALCAQTDPEAFFPEKGGSTRDAKKVCGACNVQAQCLEYALANDERFGIWGGLSERERRRLRKRAV